jgi:predicted murein hydrolase (TIGR00659 family)
MKEAFSNPLFGVTLCILAYEIGVFLNRKFKTPLANPLLIGIVLCILVLKLFGIPLEDFNQGGDIVALFLAPATASLAVSIYSQYDLLKKNLLPILAGSAVGSLCSMGSVFLMCKLFRLDEKLTVAMLPKSVTTPIAMELSEQSGGIVPVTIAAVVITGILGAMLAPTLIKLFRVNNSVAAGVAIGTCSHALGTTKAIEIGEVEGAMSGIAIGTAGLMTVLFSMVIA